MKFWDASAILPLLVEESTSTAMSELLKQDREVIVWWATETECVSAIARLQREGAIDDTGMIQILKRLDTLKSAWYEVQPVAGIRVTARRLLRVHALRAADALQLAATIAAAEHDPSSLNMVCLDERLRSAATKEGFAVLPI